jgi:hypothetical protein
MGEISQAYRACCCKRACDKVQKRGQEVKSMIARDRGSMNIAIMKLK